MTHVALLLKPTGIYDHKHMFYQSCKDAILIKSLTGR